MTSNKPLLTLYGRTYCHLCDDMIAALQVLRSDHEFALRVVDVDSDPALEEKYGELVPVLEVNGRELCHYFIDFAKVSEYLRAFG